MSKLLLRVDGSCIPNPGKMAIGVVIYKDGNIVKKVNEIIGRGTNNIAEYQAVIRGLEEIKNIPAESVEFYCDSQLVVKQLNKQFKVKNKRMIPLYERIQELLNEIKVPVFFIWNRREENKIADNLARKLLIQEEQNNRALAANDLSICREGGEGNIFLVKNQKSKKTYHVNLDVPECDCYDFQNNCQKWNLECKHIIAARRYENDRQNLISESCNKTINVLVLSKMVSRENWVKLLNKSNKINSIPLNINFKAKKKTELNKLIAEADVIIGGELNEDNLQMAKNLKLFQIPFAGVDKQNLDAFRKFPKVNVCNVHGNSHAVSEHAICLLLALAKDLINTDRDLRKGKWHGFISQETTLQLHGRNLGIIGFGAIGLEIAKRALPFGMNIYAIKRKIKEEEQLEKIYGLTFLGNHESLEYVIKMSDFIIVAVPLTEKTNNMLDGDMLKLMKDKYLINIGRGRVVDEKALYHNLKNGHLAGAAIDTWYRYPDREHPETLPGKYPFHELDNIIMTPHNAGYSDKAVEENIQSVYNNITRIFYGEEPENKVDLSEGY
ncbi:MAG: NAD(P)-dependent oxidoreductase [Atribacterota bacterium]|jgi:phosphoglycerate dehydrogenase-like enzyme/ribonuclease HI|nr:NAD(P)-dependent oxidoreductase [Atribacterota bacterium]